MSDRKTSGKGMGIGQGNLGGCKEVLWSSEQGTFPPIAEKRNCRKEPPCFNRSLGIEFKRLGT
jgi:hypothetical protein